MSFSFIDQLALASVNTFVGNYENFSERLNKRIKETLQRRYGLYPATETDQDEKFELEDDEPQNNAIISEPNPAVESLSSVSNCI
jgi:hypothetical protein